MPLNGALAEDRELDCLANNIYYEARGEPTKGKLAVALVTINRAHHPAFPSTICGVVFQKHQFSWTRKYGKVKSLAGWLEARELAAKALDNRNILGNFSATHFHNLRVSPGWKLRRVAKIGNHVFYSL